MRLFAAVLPPDDVVDELASVVEELKGWAGGERLRWTEVAGWHFTLAFYGEVDEGVVPELSRRLERAARRTDVFSLAVRGGGQFGRGRALWVGAEGGVEDLRSLADRAEAAARKAGVDMRAHRRYRPHLTLARSREDADVRAYVDVLDGFAGRIWTVSHLALVRSDLPTSGVPGEQPRYEVVERWGLGAAG